MSQLSAHRGIRFVGGFALLFSAVAARSIEVPLQEPLGVVVEEVGTEFVGEQVGIQAGDILLGWCRTPGGSEVRGPSGPIRQPSDLDAMENEEGPRGLVTLEGRRGSETRQWLFPPSAGHWSIEVRPLLDEDDLAAYRKGRAAVEAKDVPAAVAAWSGVIERAGAKGRSDIAGWLWLKIAEAYQWVGRWEECDRAYERTVDTFGATASLAAVAQAERGWARAFYLRSDWEPGIEHYRRAAEIEHRIRPDSLGEARTLSWWGFLETEKGDFPSAREHFQQALQIRQAEAPDSLEVPRSWQHLAIAASEMGDTRGAETAFLAAEAAFRRLAPDTFDHAASLGNLGEHYLQVDELEKAEAALKQSFAIFRRYDPNSTVASRCLLALATIATERGDLVAAEESLRPLFQLWEKQVHFPGLGDLPLIAWNLGRVALARFDLEAAERYLGRALELKRKLQPGTPDLAGLLEDLARVDREKRDFPAARARLQEALALWQTIAPGSLQLAETLVELGRLELEADADLPAAERSLGEAAALFEALAPKGAGLAEAKLALSRIAALQGETERALRLATEAAAIRGALAPAGHEYAEALRDRGRAERRAGDPAAVRSLCSAIDVLDAQRGHLGGTPETAATFEGKIGDYYWDCIKALVERGRREEAFAVLERGRARSLLKLLGERELRYAELSPELLQRRRQLARDYDRTQAALLARSTSLSAAELDRLTGVLREVQGRQEELVAEIRKASPQLARIAYPQPLDLAQARSALDPGTVLLAYALGEETGLIFVVTPADDSANGLAVLPLPWGRKRLGEEVSALRSLLGSPRTEVSTIREKARELYAVLVAPARAEIERAGRLLIAPDGPLHALPFGALFDGHRYLIEEKPLHFAPSATAYAELRKARPGPARRDAAVVAFGDPVYPAAGKPGGEPLADPQVRSSAGRGLNLDPLPASRKEVESLAGLYPGARTFLGARATEEKVRETADGARILHFATHGLVDERLPLNSGLALTIPEHPAEGQQNGLLQAWEIFESLRLDADLVTLSACDTALGKDSGGEGLLGLTRAFQFAGARSVIASLWSVSDAATPELMRRFYTYLHKGKSKDEALERAQVDLLRSGDPRFTHPAQWAAFQLYGSWR